MKKVIVVATMLLACTSTGPRLSFYEYDKSDALLKDDFEYDKTLIAKMAIGKFESENIDLSDSSGNVKIRVAVGIADDVCASNQGEVVYVAFEHPSDTLTYDAIVRVIKGKYAGVSKINMGHSSRPEDVVRRLKYSPRCVKRREVKSVSIGIDCSEKNGDKQSIVCAVRDGDLHSTESLIKKGSDVNSVIDGGVSLLMIAGADGNKAIAEVLLNNGANINALDSVGCNALAYAIKSADFNTIKHLIEKGCDVNGNADEYKPLLVYLCQKDMGEIAELFVNNGADVNIADHRGITALHEACENGNIALSKLLISNGADVNRQAKMFNLLPPMHMAARKGHVNILKLLSQNGADVNYKTGGGTTSLRAALGMGQYDAVAYLLSQGADVNVQDINGETALLHAVRYGYNKLPVIRAFISSGADVNIKGVSGKTAVMVAASRFKNFDEIELLLKAGADLDIKDNKGNTAYDYAMQNEYLANSEKIEMLKPTAVKTMNNEQ